MNNFNVEICGIVILLILVFDYYSKFRYSSLISLKFLVTLSCSIFTLSICSIFSYIPFFFFSFLMLAVVPSLLINNYLFDYDSKKYRFFMLVYFLFYEIIILLGFRQTVINVFCLILSFIPFLISYSFVIYNMMRGRKNGLYKQASFTFLLMFLGFSLDIYLHDFVFCTFSYTVCLLVLYLLKYSNDINLDLLTNAYNRRFMDSYLVNCRDRKNVLFMIDVDNFKRINDTYGHREGDYILIEVADALRNSVSNKDYVIRYGGDEFVIISDYIGEKEIEKIIDVINKNLQSNRCKEYGVTLSIGYEIYDGKFGYEEYINKADLKMYKNKSQK